MVAQMEAVRNGHGVGIYRTMGAPLAGAAAFASRCAVRAKLLAYLTPQYTYNMDRVPWRGVTGGGTPRSPACAGQVSWRLAGRLTVGSSLTVGAILLEQNDEWAVQRARYTRRTMASLLGKMPITPVRR